MDFYIIINTYKRPEKLNKLIDQLKNTEYDIFIHVYSDGCGFERHDVKVTNLDHHGRENYYRIINKNFGECQKAKYYLKLDDDMELVPGFYEKCIDAWESISDRSKMTLNLLKDYRTTMWGSHEPKYCNELTDLTQWVDLNFMFDDKFLNAFSYLKLEPPTIDTSSGVARQITRHLRKFGNMYQVRKTLLIHGDHPSMMNPGAEKQWKNDK